MTDHGSRSAFEIRLQLMVGRLRRGTRADSVDDPGGTGGGSAEHIGDKNSAGHVAALSTTGKRAGSVITLHLSVILGARMATLVATCPRCFAAHSTMDVLGANHFELEYGWARRYEIAAICRSCHRLSVIIALQAEYGEYPDFSRGENSITDRLDVEGWASYSEQRQKASPSNLPEEISTAFAEATRCLGVECWNASGAMFRRCLDIATRDRLPKEPTEGLNEKTRRDLGLRLPWLFANRLLPVDIQPLSECIHQDGNDGAHATLNKDDAEDLYDFTFELLERLFTEPARLEAAKQRRAERRAKKI